MGQHPGKEIMITKANKRENLAVFYISFNSITLKLRSSNLENLKKNFYFIFNCKIG